jgi:hypothetical protein
VIVISALLRNPLFAIVCTSSFIVACEDRLGSEINYTMIEWQAYEGQVEGFVRSESFVIDTLTCEDGSCVYQPIHNRLIEGTRKLNPAQFNIYSGDSPEWRDVEITETLPIPGTKDTLWTGVTTIGDSLAGSVVRIAFKRDVLLSIMYQTGHRKWVKSKVRAIKTRSGRIVDSSTTVYDVPLLLQADRFAK